MYAQLTMRGGEMAGSCNVYVFDGRATLNTAIPEALEWLEKNKQGWYRNHADHLGVRIINSKRFIDSDKNPSLIIWEQQP